VNQGFLPVAISEVGFVTGATRRRATLGRPLDLVGSKLPHRLGPFAGTTIYGSDPDIVSEHVRRSEKPAAKLIADTFLWEKSRHKGFYPETKKPLRLVCLQSA
jgi:hypothetical protein